MLEAVPLCVCVCGGGSEFKQTKPFIGYLVGSLFALIFTKGKAGVSLKPW